MDKFIFSVSYEIIPEKRTEYLQLMQQIKQKFNSSANIEYAVYEDARQPNLMTEVYFLKSEKDVEKVRLLQESKTDDLLNKIDDFILNLDQVAIRRYNSVV